MTPQSVDTCRARVDLTIPVREEVLRSAAEKAFRRFPYYARTVRLNEENAFVLEPGDAPIVVKKDGAPVTLRSEEVVVMKKVFGKELIVLWVSLAALICAAISLNSSLNQLAQKEQDNDMD